MSDNSISKEFIFENKYGHIWFRKRLSELRKFAEYQTCKTPSLRQTYVKPFYVLYAKLFV